MKNDVRMVYGIMKKKRLLPSLFFVCFFIFVLFFIVRLLQWYASPDRWVTYEEVYGSFTPDKTYSYDEVFYAVQEVEKDNDIRYIKVCIYEADTDALVYSFYPARARDFWGICWESDSYNIWTQSGDIGVFCYRYDNRRWMIDETAVRPADIVSVYDD